MIDNAITYFKNELVMIEKERTKNTQLIQELKDLIANYQYEMQARAYIEDELLQIRNTLSDVIRYLLN